MQPDDSRPANQTLPPPNQKKRFTTPPVPLLPHPLLEILSASHLWTEGLSTLRDGMIVKLMGEFRGLVRRYACWSRCHVIEVTIIVGSHLSIYDARIHPLILQCRNTLSHIPCDLTRRIPKFPTKEPTSYNTSPNPAIIKKATHPRVEVQYGPVRPFPSQIPPPKNTK